MALLLALFLELFWTLALSQEGVPVISQHPTGGIYSSEDSVSLTCQTESPVSSIHWYRNEEMVGSGPTHTIASFSASVAGNYTCRATTNGVGTVTSALAELQLAVLNASPPGTVSTPEPHIVQHHEPTILTCGPVDSVPSTVYSWEIFEEIGIDPSTDRAIKGDDGLLYLQDPQDSQNEEIFSCTVRNTEASETQTGYIELIVEESDSDFPRSMMAVPQDVTANVGDTISFQCIVGGSPVQQTSDIQWTTPEGVSPRLTQKNSILTVRNVATTDMGLYSCNVSGLSTFSANLMVLVPPILHSSLTPQNVTFGQPLTLSCSAQNIMVTSWLWYHNGQPLEGTTDGTFTLTSTDLSHAGVYQCFAYNSAGNDSSAALVSVHTIPATITQHPSPPQQLTFEGADITYTCSGDGAPPPATLWLFNNLPLSENIETSGLTSVLTLSSVAVEMEGVYMCRVVNDVSGVTVGSEEAEVELVVIAPTTITTDQLSYIFIIGEQDILPCQATAQEGATLEFDWTKDGEPLVISDRLSYVDLTTSGDISISEMEEGDGGEYTCHVRTMYQGLVALQEQTYTFTVEAVPETLIGAMLLPISAITSTSFTIQWYFPGARAQTRLTSYTLTYRLAGDTDPIGDHTQPIGVLTVHTFTDSEETPVKPYTKYVATVWANYMVEGSVPSNNETVMTLEDVPSAPQGVTVGVVNNTAVLVEWLPPAFTNGIITNYTIRYKLTVTNSLYLTTPLATNTTQHTLTGLLQRASYQVQVAGSTAEGMGPYSEVAMVFTEKEEDTSSTPIHQRIWFILVMFILGVIAIIAVVLVICGIRYLFSAGQSKAYNVGAQVGGLNEKLRGRSGFGGRTDALSLTEDAMVDYEGRGRRNGEAIDGNYATIKALEALESESTLTDPFKYSYEPSLSTTASRVSSQAPPYINPPSFEDALKRPRLHSAYSNSTIDHQPPSTYTESDWALEADSKTRMMEEVSPAHSAGRESSLASPGEQQVQPPLREEGEVFPNPRRKRHASHGGLDREEEQGSRRVRGTEKQAQPSSLEDLQGTSGYNHLPVRHLSHDQVPPKMNSSLAKASSQPNFATFV